MKRFMQVSFIAVVVLAGCIAGLRFAFVRAAGKQFAALYPGGAMAVKSIVFWPPGKVSVSGIACSSPAGLRVSVEKAEVSYAGMSLLRGIIPRVHAEGVSFIAGLPGKPFAAVLPQVSNAPDARASARFGIGRVLCERCSFDIKSKDIIVSGTASFETDIQARHIRRLDLRVPSLQVGEFKAKDVEASVLDPDTGVFSVGGVSFSKCKAGAFSARLCARPGVLVLKDISGMLWSGEISANILLRLDLPVSYDCTVRADKIDLAKAVSELELAEKIELTGTIGGTGRCAGVAGKIPRITGRLTDSLSGGILNILDQRLLAPLAQRSNQPVDMLMRGFKNYQYRRATVGIFSQDNSMVFRVGFSGEQGKREFDITWHNETGGGNENADGV
jgi:hypothetical protein